MKKLFSVASILLIISLGNVHAFTACIAGIDKRMANGAGGTSIAVISFFDGINDDLMVAHCNDVSCNTSNITVLDSAGSVGQDSAIAIGADGIPVISYQDQTNGRLNVVKCYGGCM